MTKLLRDEGCKIGAIYPSKEINDKEASFEIKKFGKIEDHNLIENVAVKKSYTYAKASNSPKVIALDFGVKENILRILKNKGAEIIVVPSTTSAKDIKNFLRMAYFFPMAQAIQMSCLMLSNRLKR